MADGLARSGFDVDLAFGEARESAFVLAIRDAHVEVKCDRKYPRITGRVAIEIRQGSASPRHGKPSGLAVTESPWWTIEYADDCFLTLRTSLVKVLAARAQEKYGTRMIGDGNRFENILVPIEWFIRPWKVLP